MFGNLAAFSAPKNDSNKPREPPPPATPVDFPCCRPQGLKRPARDQNQDLAKLFTNILRTGPSLQHLEALNVVLIDEVPTEQLLPADSIPPSSWVCDPTTDESPDGSAPTSATPQFLSNGAPTPGRKAFFDSVKELAYDNEDAFRAVQRLPPLANGKPAKVVYFRKFWDGLTMMADFWDTSLDKYHEDTEENTKKENNKAAMDIDELRSDLEQAGQKVDNEDGVDGKKKKYTGRRTGTGRDMPGNFREDTVFAFIETLVGAFRCSLEHANTQPRLKMQRMILPLPHAGSVHRIPRDTERAKKRILEGPVLGVYCREQTCWRRSDETTGEGKQEIMDLLRETGLLLMLAQKRAREGKEEEVPGQGKWWTHAPRWGGGTGGETGAAEDEVVEEPESADAPRKRTKKVTKADSWRTVRPPSSSWEKNIAYMQIGRDKKSEYDDIYLISSVNHHISILHVRIHLKYIDYLDRNNSTPNGTSDPAQQPWYRLQLQRSKWFDLLVANDRIEAMRGIWGILGYLMKDGQSTSS